MRLHVTEARQPMLEGSNKASGRTNLDELQRVEIDDCNPFLRREILTGGELGAYPIARSCLWMIQ